MLSHNHLGSPHNGLHIFFLGGWHEGYKQRHASSLQWSTNDWPTMKSGILLALILGIQATATATGDYNGWIELILHDIEQAVTCTGCEASLLVGVKATKEY